MIGEILAFAAIAVNLFVLYTLYLRQGFPGMFSELPGLVALALLTASFGYAILAKMYGSGPRGQEDEDEAAVEEEARRFWRQLNMDTPTPSGREGDTPSQPRQNGDDDILLQALAQNIRTAKLVGDIGISITIPEHRVKFGGHDATLRGQMVFTTPVDQEAPQPPEAEKTEAVRVPPSPPTGNPILDFIRRKKSELLAGEVGGG